jgi:hypothetical protein
MGGGGGGGRGVGVALGAAAKTLMAERTVDSLLIGCWVPRDSAQADDRLRDRDVFVLRFIRSVVTDVPAAAPVAAPARSQLAPTREAPAGARVQNTAPRALSDSTYLTEWYEKDARVQLTFTVHGDTLRGKTARVVGDMVFAGQLTALRGACPR